MLRHCARLRLRPRGLPASAPAGIRACAALAERQRAGDEASERCRTRAHPQASRGSGTPALLRRKAPSRLLKLWSIYDDVVRTRGHAVSASLQGSAEPKKEKKAQQGLRAWLWDQVLHLYHGFRLLGVNVRVTMRLKKQMAKGQKLTRRERQLLETTTKDLLRLVPFSVFVIVPGGELLLPVALSMFPNLMPSTFDTTDKVRRRHIMENLKTGIARRRLFEHMTMRIMVAENFRTDVGCMDTFNACVVGGPVSETAIRNFCTYFEDEGPLAMKKLPFYVLSDLSVLSGVIGRSRLRLESVFLPQSWIEVRLRYLLDQHLLKLEEDDRCLVETDLSKMTFQELELECARRKMRWIGPPEALKHQLESWLTLSLDPDVPNHLLLFLFPNATDSDVMLKCLSKDEQDHILGLSRFRDTPQYMFLKDVTKRAAAKSQAEIQEGVMAEDIDAMKEHIEEVIEENLATTEEFADMREALKTTTDEELMEYFDDLTLFASIEACNLEGDVGVSATKLSTMLSTFLERKGVAISVEQATRSLAEFDLDETEVISREEFVALVARIRMDR